MAVFKSKFALGKLELGRVAPLSANVPMLYEGGEIDAHPVSLAQMTTNRALSFNPMLAASLYLSLNLSICIA